MRHECIRCPECRTRRVDKHLMVLHRIHCPRPLCRCGGYHYAHRPGSKFCNQNPRGPLMQAMRFAETEDERLTVLAEWAFESVRSNRLGGEPPF